MVGFQPCGYPTIVDPRTADPGRDTSSRGLTCVADRGYPVSVVHLRGPFTVDGPARLRAAVLSCLAVEPELVVVDLAGLTSADDDGRLRIFGTLAAQAAEWPGSTLVLASVSQALAAAVRRSGADVACYPTVAAARGRAAPAQARERIRESLPKEPMAAPVARRLVDRVCREWSLADLTERAELVVSELVANAVRHAGRQVTLTLSRHQDQLQISVRDDNDDAPRRGDADGLDEHGRGLTLVEAMAATWGTTSIPGGKVVWAKVAPAHGEEPSRYPHV